MGIFFEQNMNNNNPANYIENINCTNPCFTGDMQLLTEEGYKRFDELEGNTNITVINNVGEKSYGNKVWCSGVKETVKVKLSNGTIITCTPNHVFMLNDGTECEAKDLLHKHVAYGIKKKPELNKDFIRLGFVQGDGNLTRLNSISHTGIEVNIGKKDGDILNLFEKNELKSNGYWPNCKNMLVSLGFSSECLPNRRFPTTYSNWDKKQKASFLNGLYSANGSVVTKYRVQFKTTCAELVKQLQEALKEFGIVSNVTTNRPKKIKFSNGEYVCKQSYDVCINRYDSIVKFAENINFFQEYKQKALSDLILYRSPYVISVKPNGKHKVYDFTENINHWGIVEGVVVHNCSEYIAGTIKSTNPQNYGGACNLGSVFLHNFVLNPFTKEAKIDYTKLECTIRTAVRMLDDIVDINKFPNKIYENYQKNMRTIGLGYTGLADMLAMLGLRYDSKEARTLVDTLMLNCTQIAYKESIRLAIERGPFKFCDKEKHANTNFVMNNLDTPTIEKIRENGIRNAKIFAVAPTGTLSMVFGNNCSSGIEPIFSLSYDRKVKIGGQDEDNAETIKMMDYAYYLYNKKVENGEKVDYKPEDIFVTALNIDVQDHVNMLAVIAKHIDMSVSKTINVPTDYPFEKTKDIYMDCWKKGVKGCTIFRPNPIRPGILSINESSNTDTEKPELKRGDIIQCSDDLIGRKRKLVSGCGSLHILAYFDPTTGEMQEVYLNMGSGGGCLSNTNALSRTISLLLRAGVDIYSIKDQLDSVFVCPAYATRTATKHDTSKGRSCPSAVGNALVEMWEEVQQELNLPIGKEKVQAPHIVAPQPKTTEVSKDNKCPECGAELQHIGGCVQCSECFWSKCS